MASRTAAATAMMAKSQSVPGLMALGTTMPKAINNVLDLQIDTISDPSQTRPESCTTAAVCL
eukprot:5779315-Amphidinium_carterae.1